jgi:transcriptional regulator with XRE-family HTH domain
MARKKKEFNKNGTFQKRFTDLWYKSGKTQEQLAKALGVTRPTVVGWSDGRNLPDIESLERITKLFGVSADYLLGLSDTVSPDVSLRAAVEYTGLSEEAVERLHIGLDDFECDGVGISENEKRENVSTTSMLIQSAVFIKMLRNLKEISFAAYTERIMEILWEEYSECDQLAEDDLFKFIREEDRRIVVDNLADVYGMSVFLPEVSIFDEMNGMSDDELMGQVFQLMANNKDKSELYQFHAAKAFTGYIDQVIRESRQKAEQKFLKSS